jgi:hypothetical protein
MKLTWRNGHDGSAAFISRAQLRALLCGHSRAQSRGGWRHSRSGNCPPPDKPQSQIPEKVSPPLEDGAKENKLQRENGVIKPPANIDPGMTEKPPETGGRMPVIPPPGTRGGNPSLKPK